VLGGALGEAQEAAERLRERLAVGRAQEVQGCAARDHVLAAIGRRQGQDRDVSRRRVALQRLQRRGPGRRVQIGVEQDRVRPEGPCEGHRRVAAERGNGLAACRATQVERGACHRAVVVAHEQHPVARLDGVTVVVQLVRSRLPDAALVGRRDLHHRGGRGRHERRHGPVEGMDGLVVAADLEDRRRPVADRQVERERAPRSLCRPHVDLAAEQPRDLPTDREAEPRAAVPAARRAVGLLERLEDQVQLVLRHPIPVSSTSKARTCEA
jgi:hypothetical protein